MKKIGSFKFLWLREFLSKTGVPHYFDSTSGRLYLNDAVLFKTCNGVFRLIGNECQAELIEKLIGDEIEFEERKVKHNFPPNKSRIWLRLKKELTRIVKNIAGI
jgi:hypothetical protein